MTKTFEIGVRTEEQRTWTRHRGSPGLLHDHLVDLAPDRLALGRVVLGEGLVDQLVDLGQLDAEVGVAGGRMTRLSTIWLRKPKPSGQSAPQP